MNMVYDAEERSEDCPLSEHTLEYSVSLFSRKFVMSANVPGYRQVYCSVS